MLHEISINNGNITIDGTKLRGVRSVSFDQACDTVPEVSLELALSKANIDTLAELNVAIDIADIREAIYCLQLEMKLDTEFRNATVASAKSALIEQGIAEDGASEIASAVVKRIFDL